jgi:hypothetical protein
MDLNARIRAAAFVVTASLVSLAGVAAAQAQPTSTATATGGSSQGYVPGQVLVRFNSGADRSDRAAALDEVNGKTRERFFVPGSRLVEIDGPSVPSAVAELERQPGVRYAEPNWIEDVDLVPNDPDFGLQWAHQNTGQVVDGVAGTPDADIDSTAAWDTNVGSESVIVGIADTGVAHTHEDLLPNRYDNPDEVGGAAGVDDDGNGFVDDLHGWDFNDDDNNAAPSGVAGSNHGTEVAGSAGAQGNNSVGVAGSSWEVSLMPLRVGDTGLFVSQQIEAYGYANELGAQIVNLSGGGPTLSQLRLDAIRAASDTLFVFAAGNDSTDNDSIPQYPCVHNEPNVVCVAATDQDDDLASFSNFGAATVDLAAPGVNIRTTNTPGNSYAFPNGTSFSSPIVAGAAAVYIAEHPSATPAQTRNALRCGVDKPASLNNMVETDGRLNLVRTLAIPPSSACPGSTPPKPSDKTAPETTITKHPKNKVKTKKKKKKVKYEFTSTEAGSTFECKFDKKDFAPCTSPHKKKVKKGKHKFQVRATDQAGNADQTPDNDKFKVKRKKKK